MGKRSSLCRGDCWSRGSPGKEGKEKRPACSVGMQINNRSALHPNDRGARRPSHRMLAGRPMEGAVDVRCHVRLCLVNAPLTLSPQSIRETIQTLCSLLYG
jgi:hypothetical protein